MLNETYKLKESIDVFVSETESPDKVLIIFHKMTTRDRIEIIAGKGVAEFLALLDGKTTTVDILSKLGNFDNDSAASLIEFLSSQRLIVNFTERPPENQRYKRQIAYFDDLILDRPGHSTQEQLKSKHVTIFGCGAVGGSIAEILGRAGVGEFLLIDYKRVAEGNLVCDTYSTRKDIGNYKTDVLAAFLNTIDSNINISTINEQLLPHTDLSSWIPKNTSLVINTCDEPYIGHTSLKIGRHLHQQEIPFYVAGGFDAHLMSSGELIFPPFTPCIDCAQKTFSVALENWKPTYSSIEDSDENISFETTNNYIAGGSGGFVALSAFSANLASLRILEFISGDSSINFNTVRYEYLINSGFTTEFEMQKQENCCVCNDKI
ncbi:ThiF family adenylyltransferase [Zoogloea oleivorans]|uniref:ThiF family adenylyltransferase n=2 Tax=Zoogloea oleivorans TaxID=1552750 RepID=A0A6C2D5D3_9RHOO|nr:ThiF family adenylyltransferase [Zoogloea oleivorans]